MKDTPNKDLLKLYSKKNFIYIMRKHLTSEILTPMLTGINIAHFRGCFLWPFSFNLPYVDIFQGKKKFQGKLLFFKKIYFNTSCKNEVEENNEKKYAVESAINFPQIGFNGLRSWQRPCAIVRLKHLLSKLC